MNNEILPSDVVINSLSDQEICRYELEEFLCDVICALVDEKENDRLSNGYVADTLLRCIDFIVSSDELKNKLNDFIAHDAGEE